MRVAGIGFDLDHTLAIDNRLERVLFLRLLERLLERGGHSVGTFGDEIDGIDRLLTRQRAGEFTIERAVEMFVTDHGLEDMDSYARWFCGTALGMVEDFVVPLPGVKETISLLRERGIATAVLTNGWNPLQQRKAERAGFVGPVLVSSEIGTRKPSAKSFAWLLETLDTRPEESWFVGDTPQSDVAGAQRAAMTAVWINWEHLEYPRDMQPPEYTITSFPELLDLLPQHARAS